MRTNWRVLHHGMKETCPDADTDAPIPGKQEVNMCQKWHLHTGKTHDAEVAQ